MTSPSDVQAARNRVDALRAQIAAANAARVEYDVAVSNQMSVDALSLEEAGLQAQLDSLLTAGDGTTDSALAAMQAAVEAVDAKTVPTGDDKSDDDKSDDDKSDDDKSDDDKSDDDKSDDDNDTTPPVVIQSQSTPPASTPPAVTPPVTFSVAGGAHAATPAAVPTTEGK